MPTAPRRCRQFARGARANGFGVLICAAGMAAHLAGAFAGNSTLPVIGIPMKGGAMDGLDALLATVQMPSGIPVATVAINGAKNAAVLAAQILSVSDECWPPSWTPPGRRWRSRSPPRRPSSGRALIQTGNRSDGRAARAF